jgi:O-antigen ligase
MTLTLFAGTFGALTVIYDFARGQPTFSDPTKYLWNASGATLFRPGGIYSGPPGAATVLCFVLFFGLASLPRLQGRVRKLALVCMGICALAVILTFTRAPLIGACLAIPLYLWLLRSPLLRPGRVALFAVALAATVLLVLPTLETNSTFREGILRNGTLQARQGYWKLALPIAYANTHNLVLGIGTGSLETPAISDLAPLSFLVATTPQVKNDSLHNQYITTLVEQGIVGLTALVCLLLAVCIPAARAARRTGNAAYAAVAASVVVLAVVFTEDTQLLHTPTVVMFMVIAGFAARARACCT